MSSFGLAAVWLACALTFTTAQSSCKNRCGMGYYRGYTCQCDYSCLFYGECCRDYESLCTTKNSCKGRCGETFKRGRPCSCDAECLKYNQCCPDYKGHCDELDPAPVTIEQPMEGTDPGDTFIPTVNPTSYPQDDPDSVSKQVFPNNELDSPDPSPLPEGSSGSPPTDLLEDVTTGPPLPDLDGFEILPEPVTVSTETTAAPSEGETTPGWTTADPSTAATTDIDHTIAPEPSTAASFTSTQQTSDPTTSFTDLQTDPTQTTEALPVTSEPPLLSSEMSTSEAETAFTTETTEEMTTSFTGLQTDPNQPLEGLTVTSEPPLLSSETPTLSAETATTRETTEEMTTSVTELQTDPTQTPEDLTVTSEPPLLSSEVPTLPAETTITTETTEETTTLTYEASTILENIEPSTIPPTSTIAETTTIQEKSTTESPTPTTSAPSVSEMSTTHSEFETTTAKGQDLTSSPTSSPTSTPASKPGLEKPLKPVLSSEHKPVLNGLGVETEYQADDSNDTNLCSGRPISGLTTLSNGTVVVFRGHYFWVLDRNRVPGPARGITQVWGIPSPIDTVFTRCNCQGKTYIFKGPQYWRYDNDVLDSGYPKVIQTGFDGLRGHITAALSVPQYNRRRESVYFFKRGGTVQKYSYQFGTNPSCGRKLNYAIYTHPSRIARQVSAQVSLLEPAINYRTSWRGFPPTITAAVSIPNKREPEGYSYYVFSRSKSYRIRMEGERPVVAASKPNTSHQSNEVFKCPKKVSRSQ